MVRLMKEGRKQDLPTDVDGRSEAPSLEGTDCPVYYRSVHRLMLTCPIRDTTPQLTPQL